MTQRFDKPSRIVITCQRGWGPYLQQELKELNYPDGQIFPGGVALRGTLRDCIRLNLQLRCASQVLYSIRQFGCDNPDDLYRTLRQIDWESWIAKNGYFSVTSNVQHPTIRSSMFANVRVKDAVVDRIREKTGSRPNSGAELLGAVVHLFWRRQQAEVFIDTSGATISRHGYRKLPGKAPMIEALAAAAILTTGWDLKTPFVNPMCGSGTVAIEAALLASGRRPGLYRSEFAFQHLPGYQPDYLLKAKAEIESQVRTPTHPPHIVASDLDANAVETAQRNARAANVEQLIRFQVCDFESTIMPEGGNGVVFFNPEYGERLGEVDLLKATYKRIGDFLKQRCGGYRGYVFTANLELAKSIGLRAKRRLEFNTAKLDARLLEYELYAGSRKKTAEA